MTMTTTWQEDLADAAIDHGIDVVAYVPDSKLEPIMARFRQRDITIRTLAREEECIAYAAGVYYGGRRPLVCIQCSGLGNAMNALGSLVMPASLGIPMVMSMRGTIGETNPVQIPIGLATPAMLHAIGIPAYELRDPAEAATSVRQILSMGQAGITAALLLEVPKAAV